jgi:hypothetical protein
LVFTDKATLGTAPAGRIHAVAPGFLGKWREGREIGKEGGRGW